MKTLLNFALCLMLVHLNFKLCNGQNAPQQNRDTEIIAPLFAGSVRAEGDRMENKAVLNNYLSKHIVYPENAINCRLQGTEVVQFTVSKTGDLENIKIVNSVCPLIDKEVVRVLNTTNGMWIPGSQNDIPVEMEKEILIVFHIAGFHFNTDEMYFLKKAKNWYLKGNRALFEHKNPEKALQCYNNALRYKPLEDALLYAIGMVKYELDDKVGAENEWNRMNSLIDKGEIETNLPLITENFKDFSGYSECPAK